MKFQTISICEPFKTFFAWKRLFVLAGYVMSFHIVQVLKSCFISTELAQLWCMYLIMNFQNICTFKPFKTFFTPERLFILEGFLMNFHILKEIMPFHQRFCLKSFLAFMARIQLSSYIAF